MAAKDDLRDKLAQIDKVFNSHDLLSRHIDKQYIQKYYKANKLAYSLFHTSSDQVHMGISRDGVYKEEDLLEAARTVEKYIKNPETTKVLELATGRGATSIYLAKKYPTTTFLGIELSQGQLDFVQKKAKKYSNYSPVLGDYHDLSQYVDGSIDVVFVVEALCHSEDKTLVLSEVKRVLKKGGILIVFDGYRTKLQSKMTKSELLAVKLTERGMAVNEFEDYPSLLNKAEKLGFSLISSEDVSLFIMPTLRKFERLAMRFFNRPRTAKTITRLFSKEFTYNAISGLLMPNLIKENLASYFITVFKK